jgi:hypothetical protein
LRVTRYIRRHHIGLVALFVALTGTAYAGTQVAGHLANPRLVKAKKKKAKRGPQGPAGPQGIPGPAGSARAYGRVSGGGDIDASHSTPGVTAFRHEKGEYCVTVPGVTQANAVIVPVMDIGYSDSANGDTAASAAGGNGCASGSFGVITYTAAGMVDDAGFAFVVP